MGRHNVTNVSRKKYRYSRNAIQEPDFVPAKLSKRAVSRCYQLKTDRCLTG